MIAKIIKKGKWNSFYCEVDGEKTYLTPSSKLTTAIEEGAEYDVEVWQPEGKKTVYITKATKKGNVVQQKPVFKPRPRPVEKPDPVASDKMTKEDWAKKDDGIKWLACIKAAAEFLAIKPEASVDDLVDTASALYFARPSKPLEEIREEIEQPETSVEGVDNLEF